MLDGEMHGIFCLFDCLFHFPLYLMVERDGDVISKTIFCVVRFIEQKHKCRQGSIQGILHHIPWKAHKNHSLNENLINEISLKIQYSVL